MNQSLKMHGHWIIDIKNADGTLVQHHEFENSIQYDGQNYLIGLMSGYGAAGPWEIYFSSANASASTSPCNTGAYPYCAIVYSPTCYRGRLSATASIPARRDLPSLPRLASVQHSSWRAPLQPPRPARLDLWEPA